MKRVIHAQTWWFPAATACAALITSATSSATFKTVVYVLVAAQILPVALISLRRDLINTRMFTVLIVIGGANAAAAILRSAAHGHLTTRNAAELLSLTSTLFIIATLALAARNRRGRDVRGVLADGAIVALGTWLLVWVSLVRPAITTGRDDVWSVVFHSAYQPISSIVVFLLILLLFSDTERTRAVWCISIAIVMTLSADLLQALAEARHIRPLSDMQRSLDLVAYGFVFAALLEPSVRALSERQPIGPHRPMFGRIIATTGALVVPMIVIAATVPRGRLDIAIRTVSVGLLSLFATARVVHAVRANRTAQEDLLRSAQTDPLTGLPNRGLLLEHVNATLSDAWRGSAHPTLFFIDLDRFKNINDSLGHAAGDRVLCTVADRLRRAVPERALVARISGDEYVVLDPASPSLGAAMSLAERLLNEFREPLPLAAGDVFISASIGVARSEPQSYRDADLLLRHADTAMYQAKDAGRNCVALFDESMHERVAHRLAVETALFRALDRRELRLFHQPILEMSTGEVIGFEALMRWQQGDGTIISPAEFIPIAEETGNIIAIGSWALLEALNQLRSWIDEGVCSNMATMSVNVSPRQLADHNFPSIVNEALLRSRVSPHLLWLEITEGIMITEPELALATLRRLRSLGVRVALDDFGTGYSSLSLLQKFPLQRIKIDRAFVHGVADNANDRSLVRTIIAMGSSLGLDMVAEGVETVLQLQVLSELGCTKAQGYLISHPIPADAMRTTVTALERMGAWPGVHRPRESVMTPEEEFTG